MKSWNEWAEGNYIEPDLEHGHGYLEALADALVPEPAIPDELAGARVRTMTIYYVAPDLARPSGGVRTIYRHVDALNRLGLDAAVVHATRGFRCEWFEHDTAVVHLPLTLSSSDTLVVPEDYAPRLGELVPGVPKVIFNQNAYRTFNGFRDPRHTSYTDCPDLLGVMVVSEDSRRYLEHCFPELRVRAGASRDRPRCVPSRRSPPAPASGSGADEAPARRDTAAGSAGGTRRAPRLGRDAHRAHERGGGRRGVARVVPVPEHEPGRRVRAPAGGGDRVRMPRDRVPRHGCPRVLLARRTPSRSTTAT